MEIIGKIWILTNIAKMGLTADQPQSPMKIIKQMWKSANITKISPSGTQCRYPMKTITMLPSFHCSRTLVWLNSRLLQIVFNSLKGGEIFVNTRLRTNVVHANRKQVITGISSWCITLYIKYTTCILLGRLTHTHTHPQYSGFYPMKPLKTKEIRAIRSSFRVLIGFITPK